MHPEISALLREPYSGVSPPPRVKLIGGHLLPFEEVVASARTCYSSRGIVLPEEILARKFKKGSEELKTFASDLYRAGHHTVFQHAHFTFAIEGVSRLLVWSFFHSHPFYNSEQVSQRYVHVGEGGFLIPQSAERDPSYREAIAHLHKGYEELTLALLPKVETLYYERFPARRSRPAVWQKGILRKAQEIARYLLPQATCTSLHHTISTLTLMRYVRSLNAGDAPGEARYVVGQMLKELYALSPELLDLFEPPLSDPSPDLTDNMAIEPSSELFVDPKSELLSYTQDPEKVLLKALAGVMNRPVTLEELKALLDPERMPVWCDTLNLTHHHPLLRIFLHVHYSFEKVLSLTADSQNQRHRLTPSTHPRLLTLPSLRAILPLLIAEDGELSPLYKRLIEEAFARLMKLQKNGWGRRELLYLLPNATAINIVESSDFLSIYHKMRMRLCYNAQEEIWRLCYEESRAIRQVHPWLGEWLLPPCTLRARGKRRPICPEGSRFCGVKVWELPFSKFSRGI